MNHRIESTERQLKSSAGYSDSNKTDNSPFNHSGKNSDYVNGTRAVALSRVAHIMALALWRIAQCRSTPWSKRLCLYLEDLK